MLAGVERHLVLGRLGARRGERVHLVLLAREAAGRDEPGLVVARLAERRLGQRVLVGLERRVLDRGLMDDVFARGRVAGLRGAGVVAQCARFGGSGGTGRVVDGGTVGRGGVRLRRRDGDVGFVVGDFVARRGSALGPGSAVAGSQAGRRGVGELVGLDARRDLVRLASRVSISSASKPAGAASANSRRGATSSASTRGVDLVGGLARFGLGAGRHSRRRRSGSSKDGVGAAGSSHATGSSTGSWRSGSCGSTSGGRTLCSNASAGRG